MPFIFPFFLYFMKKLIWFESSPFLVDDTKMSLDLNSYNKQKKQISVNVEQKTIPEMVGTSTLNKIKRVK